MFCIDKISITQFKNYPRALFHFDQRITCITGVNGVGKTNLLDAVYYLCFTKSYFSKTDQQNISFGESGFRIEGEFVLNNEVRTAICIMRENGKKEFILDDKIYERFSHHVGKFPCIIVAPDDVYIIIGGGESRRRYIDALLCQTDANYLQQLIDYNRTLQQRNSLLRSISEGGRTDNHLLEVYDEQMITSGIYVYETRKTLLHQLVPMIRQLYNDLAGSTEPIEIEYVSQLSQNDFKELLKQYRSRDISSLRTNAGIHKDDLEVIFHGQLFRNTASQGQRKSLLFALKLAEFELLRVHKGYPPILLLDDVFEKLDEGRMSNLLTEVCVKNRGQVLITDSHRDRITTHFDRLGASYQLVTL